MIHALVGDVGGDKAAGLESQKMKFVKNSLIV